MGDDCFEPNQPITRTISVSPPTGTSVFGVQEDLPDGWTASAISDDGEYDANNGSVKWFFLDDAARTLTYSATADAGADGEQCFEGEINFDGNTTATLEAECIPLCPEAKSAPSPVAKIAPAGIDSNSLRSKRITVPESAILDRITTVSEAASAPTIPLAFLGACPAPARSLKEPIHLAFSATAVTEAIELAEEPALSLYLLVEEVFSSTVVTLSLPAASSALTTAKDSSESQLETRQSLEFNVEDSGPLEIDLTSLMPTILSSSDELIKLTLSVSEDVALSTCIVFEIPKSYLPGASPQLLVRDLAGATNTALRGNNCNYPGMRVGARISGKDFIGSNNSSVYGTHGDVEENSAGQVVMNGSSLLYYNLDPNTFGWETHDDFNGATVCRILVLVNGEDDSLLGNGADIYIAEWPPGITICEQADLLCGGWWPNCTYLPTPSNEPDHFMYLDNLDGSVNNYGGYIDISDSYCNSSYPHKPDPPVWSSYKGLFVVIENGSLDKAIINHLDVFADVLLCTYDIPSGYNPPAAGGDYSFSVSAPSSCSWSASDNASWITITSGSGNGNGTVQYSVSSNTGTSSRTGQITVGGETYTVSQSGISCSYSISPSSKSFNSSGGSGSFSVSAPSGCNWSASDNASWITITSGSGNGNGTVQYSVSSNSGTSTRTGEITVGGKTHTVTQSGANCSYSISPSSKPFDADGGSGSFSISTDSGCSWSAGDDSSWISGATESGSGNGTITYNVASNSSTSSRTGHVTAGGKTHTVTQSGNPNVEITADVHPADAGPYCECGDESCNDGRLELCEAIGYAAAWRRGDHDIISAAIGGLRLWKTGECYSWYDDIEDWDSASCE
ncbi:MAG: BACON domain-containing protein [Phycisphaerales bacterium]|nr:BACON domain-containing protein [Phycisphaerales bacterium]